MADFLLTKDGGRLLQDTGDGLLLNEAVLLSTALYLLDDLLRLDSAGGSASYASPSYTNGLDTNALNTMALGGASPAATFGTQTIPTPVEGSMRLGIASL